MHEFSVPLLAMTTPALTVIITHAAALHLQADEVAAVLQLYSDARLTDVHAVCDMSAEGFGTTPLKQKIWKLQVRCDIYTSMYSNTQHGMLRAQSLPTSLLVQEMPSVAPETLQAVVYTDVHVDSKQALVYTAVHHSADTQTMMRMLSIAPLLLLCQYNTVLRSQLVCCWQS
jgi:hypothetical protein